jgi:hypothetical protein
MKLLALCVATMVLLGGGAVSAATILDDGGFETPVLSDLLTNGNNYLYPNGAAGGWVFNSAGLISTTAAASNDSFFGITSPAGFSGAQYAFVQASGSLSQTFSMPAASTARVEWLEGSRPRLSASFGGDHVYSVLINGLLVGTFATVSGQSFEAESLLVTLPAGVSTLTFSGQLATDNTVFLDNVNIAPVPLPGGSCLLVSAMTALGITRWLRRGGDQRLAGRL